MKILHLGKFYSPIEGGIESINRFIVDTLKGNCQRIISFNNRHRSTEEDVDEVPIVRTSTFGIVASQPLSIKYYCELRRSIGIFKPDIIHFHYPNPLAALYLLLTIHRNNKLILHWHSDVVAQKFIYLFIKPIERKLLKRANAIIATSPNYRDASQMLKPYRDKVSVIPCSINEEDFAIQSNDENLINKLKTKYKNPIIFFIGRHVEYKGIEYLLKAEQYISHDCDIVIAGNGPLTKALQQKYNSPRIHWIGRVSDDEKRAYYHQAAIFAFPSITRNEAFGVVLAESMYCGTPSVTFSINGSGVNWVSINNKTGIEVPNRDVRAYAKAIDTLLEDCQLAKCLGEDARRRVKELFIKGVVSKQYLDLYNKVMYLK